MVNNYDDKRKKYTLGNVYNAFIDLHEIIIGVWSSKELKYKNNITKSIHANKNYKIQLYPKYYQFLKIIIFIVNQYINY